MSDDVLLEDVPVKLTEYRTRVALQPTGIVWHRTIGRWAGDYAELTKMYSKSVHFLIGHDEDQWVQFVPCNEIANHAAGANRRKIGIELSGYNGEPLTEWQLRAAGRIYAQLKTIYGWPDEFYDGPRVYVDQEDTVVHLNHRNVAYPPNPSLQHNDYITEEEFSKISGGDMGLSLAEFSAIKNVVRDVLNEGTGFGTTSWAETSREVLAAIQALINEVRELRADLQGKKS